MTENAIELNADNFEREVLGARNPVVVQFWARWSEPSRQMVPLVEQLVGDETIPVKIGKVNVESNESLAEEYGVRAVPTLLVFNHGGLEDQIVGRTTKQDLREMLGKFR